MNKEIRIMSKNKIVGKHADMIITDLDIATVIAIELELKEAFNAGYDTSTMYNTGSCEGAFASFEEWNKDHIEKLKNR